MTFPKQIEIEVPLLATLVELGGDARPRDVYALVAKHFPQLTPEDQEVRFENYPSTRKWSNLVQWVRQRLVDLGEIDGTQRGIWRITPAGRARLSDSAPAIPPQKEDAGHGGARETPPPVALRDLVNANLEEIKRRLLSELKISRLERSNTSVKSSWRSSGTGASRSPERVRTEESMATATSGTARSAFAPRLKQNDGPAIRWVDRRSIGSGAPSKATMITASSSRSADSRKMPPKPHTEKAQSPFFCSTGRRSLTSCSSEGSAFASRLSLYTTLTRSSLTLRERSNAASRSGLSLCSLRSPLDTQPPGTYP